MSIVKNKTFVKLMLICWLVSSCETNDIPVFVNTRSIKDVVEDFNEIEFVHGINDIEIEGSYSNTVWRFRLIVPEEVSTNNKRPLVVCLHGGASIVDPNLHKHTDCLEEPGLFAINPILLCPNSEGFGWSGLPEQEKILTLTNLVKKRFSIDEKELVIMGYSDGGNGAWFYAEHYPEQFSAAIAISSAYNTLNPNLSLKIDIPMYVIHGALDELFPLNKTVDAVNGAIQAGSNIEFIIADNLGHFTPCLYAPYLEEAANWLVETVWNE